MNHFFDLLIQPYKNTPIHLVYLEFIAVFFGILSVFFSKKRHIFVYPTGIISTVIFTYLLWCSRLFGDMLINIYYTVMSIYGWVLWSQNAKDNIHIEIAKTTKKDIVTSSLLASFSFFFVMSVYYLKPYINNHFSWEEINLGFQYFAWVDWVDICTTSIFLVGMWLMAKRKIENWIFWIIGDVISVPLYFYKNLLFSSLQYIIFTIIAILAYKEWRKIYYNQQVL